MQATSKTSGISNTFRVTPLLGEISATRNSSRPLSSTRSFTSRLKAMSTVPFSTLSVPETNVIGTQNLLELRERNCRMLHVSTDRGLRFGRRGLFTECLPSADSPYAREQGIFRPTCARISRDLRHGLLSRAARTNYGPYQFPEKLIPLVFSHALQRKMIPLRRRGTCATGSMCSTTNRAV